MDFLSKREKAKAPFYRGDQMLGNKISGVNAILFFFGGGGLHDFKDFPIIIKGRSLP